MMLASWYVSLRHELPTRMPDDLLEHRDRVLFARWLVLTGRLTDWGPWPDSGEVVSLRGLLPDTDEDDEPFPGLAAA